MAASQAVLGNEARCRPQVDVERAIFLVAYGIV